MMISPLAKRFPVADALNLLGLHGVRLPRQGRIVSPVLRAPRAQLVLRLTGLSSAADRTGWLPTTP